MEKIKFLVLDVDGTLTDGKIYMGENGEVMKAFNIKDGYAIRNVLPEYGIIPIIITGRESKFVQNRCKELDIKELHQGCLKKKEKLEFILKKYSEKEGKIYSFSNCAYCGDDIIDMECMQEIRKYGGITGCPKDAVKEIQEISCFVSEYRGGEGSVRDFIDYLKNLK